MQCSWRAGGVGADRDEAVLGGSFIDARSFEVGRRDASAAAWEGLGDDAYVVGVGAAAPTTIYVLDGSRAFALWLAEPSPEGAERTLARPARQVLAG